MKNPKQIALLAGLALLLLFLVLNIGALAERITINFFFLLKVETWVAVLIVVSALLGAGGGYFLGRRRAKQKEEAKP